MFSLVISVIVKLSLTCVNIYKIGRLRFKSSASLCRAKTTRINGKSAIGIAPMRRARCGGGEKTDNFHIRWIFWATRKKCATHQNVLKEQSARPQMSTNVRSKGARSTTFALTFESPFANSGFNYACIVGRMNYNRTQKQHAHWNLLVTPRLAKFVCNSNICSGSGNECNFNR